MIVVFEGIDGVGKTTLCEGLKNVLRDEFLSMHVFYHKESSPGKFVTERLERIKLFEKRLYDKDLHIYDRATVIDDYVYEPVFTHTVSLLTTSAFLTLWITEMLQHTLVLHICAPMDVVKARLQVRGDEFVSSEQLNEVYCMYSNAYDLLDIKPVCIDSLSDNALQQCIDQITYYVKEQKDEN